MEFVHWLTPFCWIALHAGGLTVAWGTRVVSGPRLETLLQLAFFAILSCLGGVAWARHQHELGLWIPSGITMGLMVLMAVVDCSTGDEAFRMLSDESR